MMIGAKIAAARKAMGLTQEQLAEKLNVTGQAVSFWERDENLPDVKKLAVLAMELKITPNELLAEDDTVWADHQPLLSRAIEFATVKHANDRRKGTKVPYITHVVEAMEIVSHITEDEEIRAAAVLHDTLEDTETSREELVRHFGQRVADLVAAESENKREGQPEADTWEIRKQETINHLANASTDIRMIALGDKLSNIRAMSRDYQEIGEELWQRFNQKNPIKQGWYYGCLANIFSRDETIRKTREYREYADLCKALFSGEYDRDGNLIPDGETEWDELDGEWEEEEDTAIRPRWFLADQMEEVRSRVPDTTKAWALIMDRTEDPDMEQFQTMAATLDTFLRSDRIGFGDVHLQMVNDPAGHDVSWERTEDGYLLHLCIESGKNWSQAAYQLGYVMMHCLIDHLGPDGAAGISWAEELICEATALEMLYLLQDRWDDTVFAQTDPDFADAIQKDIDYYLSNRGTSALMRCGSWGELDRINEKNCFDDRMDESHDLFNAMEPEDLLKLARIRRYEADDLLIYTHYWRANADGSAAVDYICRLQENIPDCEIPAGIHQDINLKGSKPTEDQKQAYGRIIRALRPLPYEHIVFDFLDADKGEKEQIGLVFCQMARRKDGRMDVEVRLDTMDGRKMYRILTDDDRAVEILNGILDTIQAPDLTDWKDITAEVFRKDEPSEE